MFAAQQWMLFSVLRYLLLSWRDDLRTLQVTGSCPWSCSHHFPVFLSCLRTTTAPAMLRLLLSTSLSSSAVNFALHSRRSWVFNCCINKYFYFPLVHHSFLPIFDPRHSFVLVITIIMSIYTVLIISRHYSQCCVNYTFNIHNNSMSLGIKFKQTKSKVSNTLPSRSLQGKYWGLLSLHTKQIVHVVLCMWSNK